MLVVLFAACAREEKHGADDVESAVPGEVTAVPRVTFRQTVRGIGTLRAVETVEIRPELAGIVRQIHFKEGEMVGENELLFTLDDSKLRCRLAEG